MCFNPTGPTRGLTPSCRICKRWFPLSPEAEGTLLHTVPVPLPVFRTPPRWPMDADPWGSRSSRNGQQIVALWGRKDAHHTTSLTHTTVVSVIPPLTQLVKNLPAMQDTPVRFLAQEDPLEKG